jgi:hypothetical protein
LLVTTKLSFPRSRRSAAESPHAVAAAWPTASVRPAKPGMGVGVILTGVRVALLRRPLSSEAANFSAAVQLAARKTLNSVEAACAMAHVGSRRRSNICMESQDRV